MCSIWKLAIPKSKVVELILELDTDQDGYITLGEVKDATIVYGKSVKKSLRFLKRK